MRKICVVGLAFVAVFAFVALAVTSAFAESKVLANNANIVALLELSMTAALLLTDLGATGVPEILCEGILDLKIEPGGTLVYVNELLMTNGELLAGAGGGDSVECVDTKNVCSSPVVVEVLDLPWHVSMILDAPLTSEIYLAHLLTLAENLAEGDLTAGEPTHHIDCNTILGLMEDLCTGLMSGRLYSTAAGLRVSFNALALSETWGAETEKSNCTIGGAATADFESEEPGTANLDTEAAGALILDTTEPATTFQLSP